MLDFDKTIKEASLPQTSEDDEKLKRSSDIQGLVFGIVGRYAEFFAQPENRLEFIKGQTAKDFFRISQYINSKVRGEKPHELRQRPEERLGGALPMLHTPKSSDKLPAFSRGFDAIQEYLADTEDDADMQIEGVAMAAEALIIWVHPFTDGNGRTSRFMAKLIEDGASDLSELAEETVSSRARALMYRDKLDSREGVLADADNDELMLDDNERDALRKEAEELPDDIEATYLSVKRILEDDTLRKRIFEKAEAHKARMYLGKVA